MTKGVGNCPRFLEDSKMRNLFLLIALILLSTNASALKLIEQPLVLKANQDVLEVFVAVDPTATAADHVLNDNAGDTDGSGATVSTFAAQPDIPRNITVTPGGTTADVAAGDVVITGTNLKGATITETLTFTANQSTAEVGTKAFASVTSISFPAEDSPYGATWDVGIGSALGLGKCMDGAGDGIVAQIDGAADGSATFAASATAVESNTLTPNSAPDGSRDFKAFFVRNWRCR